MIQAHKEEQIIERFLRVFILAAMLAANGIANCSEDRSWNSLGVVNVPPGKAAMLIVEGLVVDATIRIRYENIYSLSQNSPQEKGMGAAIYLPPKPNSVAYRVELKRVYESGLSINASIRTFFLKDNEKITAHAETISESISKWTKNDLIGIEASRDLAKTLVPAFNSESELSCIAIESYLNMLFRLEDFEEIIQFVNLLLDAKDPNESLSCSKEFYWNLKLIRAKSGIEREDHANSLSALESLNSDLENTKHIGKVWEVNKIEVLGTIASISIQDAYRKQESLNMSWAQEQLERAILDATGLGEYKLAATLETGLGAYLWSKDDNYRSLEVLQRAMKNHTRSGPSIEMADTINIIAINYLWIGNANEALNVLITGRKIAESFRNKTREARLLLSLGSVLLKIGQDALAEIYFGRAKNLFSELGNDFGRAAANLKLGASLREQDRVDEALIVHSESYDFLAGSEQDRKKYAGSIYLLRLEIAADYMKKGLMKRAETYLSEVECELLNPARSSKFLAVYLKAILLKAQLYLAENDELEFVRCSEIIEKIYQTEGIEKAYPTDKLDHLRLQLLFHSKNNRIYDVKRKVGEFVEVVESLRAQLDINRLGLALSNKTNSVLGLYTRILARRALDSRELREIEDLFGFLERSNAISFRSNRKITNLLSNNYQLSEDASVALGVVADYEKEAVSAKNREQRNAALTRSAEAHQILSSYINSTNNGFTVDDGTISTLQEVQSALKKNQMFIKIYSDKDVSLSILVSKSRLELVDHRVGANKVLTTISNLIAQIKRRSSSGIFNTYGLTQTLGLNKVNFEEIDSLIISSEGAFNGIPLSSLNTGNLNDIYEPLGGEASITHVYSISDYLDSNKDPGLIKHTYDVAIFADPVFSRSKSSALVEVRHGTAGYRAWSKTLARLPATAREAHSISNIFGGKNVKLLLGEDATTDALMASEIRNSKILHIASHGYFNSKTPDIVGIATSGSFKNGLNDYGFLTLTELLSSKFTSNLVVISGCETSVGRDISGEGMNGISRGVLARGAGTVIGTLWPISDEPTAKFMTEFYKNLLKSSGNVSAALLMTKQEFIKSGRYKHPYFWAGFILSSANRAQNTNVFR